MRKIGMSGLLLLSVCGCSGMSNTDKGLLGGAGVGAAAGALLSRGNPVAAVAGGAIGAMVGGVAGAGQDAREDRRAFAQAQATAVANATRNQMSLNDIVQLSQGHVSDDLIIRQMDSTNSIFNLTAGDLQYLNDQGVSRNVIAAMQARTTRTVVVAPPPRGVVVYEPYPPPPSPYVGVGFGYGRRW